MLSAYSLDAFNMELGIRIPELKMMIERAYQLDPNFNNAAINEFFVIFYSSLPESLGGSRALAHEHFEKAVAKTNGLSVSPFVSYARFICIPDQDYETFRAMLTSALAINPDDDPPNRLMNILSLQKARYLMDNAGLYFISFGADWDDWPEWDDDLEDWPDW